MLKIYGSDLSVFAIKVRLAANCLKLDYEYIKVNLREGEQRKPEYLALHPAGKVPVIDDDGFVLFESNAIIRYLADKNGSDLYPKNLNTRAIIDQWIDFTTLHIGNGINKVLFNRLFAPMIPNMEVDERSIQDGLSFLERYLPLIDKHLGSYRYLAGEKMTLADIVLLATLDPVELGQIDISAYSHINKWRNALKQEEFYTKCHKEYGESLKQQASAG